MSYRGLTGTASSMRSGCVGVIVSDIELEWFFLSLNQCMSCSFPCYVGRVKLFEHILLVMPAINLFRIKFSGLAQVTPQRNI